MELMDHYLMQVCLILYYQQDLLLTEEFNQKKITAFQFYGPTCDSLDYMKGPFLLPNNIKEGDYIELGQLGAYGLTLGQSSMVFIQIQLLNSMTNP